jgi:hypothetical protein
VSANLYFYTVEDRQQQLHQLVDCLPGLIPLLEPYPELSDKLAAYRSGQKRALELLEHGFSEEELTALGRSIPDLFYRHREWEPPAEQLPDGRWHDAPWFTEVEERLQPVLKAAEQLASIGYSK